MLLWKIRLHLKRCKFLTWFKHCLLVWVFLNGVLLSILSLCTFNTWYMQFMFTCFYILKIWVSKCFCNKNMMWFINRSLNQELGSTVFTVVSSAFLLQLAPLWTSSRLKLPVQQGSIHTCGKKHAHLWDLALLAGYFLKGTSSIPSPASKRSAQQWSTDRMTADTDDENLPAYTVGMDF